MKRNRLVAMSLLVILGLMLLSSAAPALRTLPSGFGNEGPDIDSSAPKGTEPPPRGGDPDDVGLEVPKPPRPPLPPLPPGEPPPPFAPGPEMPGGTPESGNGGPSFSWLLWLAMSLSW